MIVRIVPITPAVLKYFDTIRTTGAIGSFHMIVSIASKASDAGSSAMALGQTEFLRVLQTSHINGWFLFVKRTSYLGICFFSWFCGIEKLEEFPEDSISLKTWCHGLSLISNNPRTLCKHLCIIFSASAPSGPNLFSNTGIKVMTSGIAFDRRDRLSGLRAFPYDRLKIYMIVPIVRIELNSIQAIEIVSVVRVACDRLGSVSIWSSRSSEHFLGATGTIRTIRTIIWKPGLNTLSDLGDSSNDWFAISDYDVIFTALGASTSSRGLFNTIIFPFGEKLVNNTKLNCKV